MMSKVFGRSSNEELVNTVAELSERLDEQNAGLISVNSNIAEINKMMEGFRQYVEGMEVRLHKRSEAAFNDIETALSIMRKEISRIGEVAKPQEVVKEIERQTENEKKTRALDANMAKLQEVVAEYLANDLPLVRERSPYTHPQFTPQGDVVYREVTRFLTELAKINGRNKEYYTNASVYQKFFNRFGIKRYKRATVRTSDGKQMTTLLAAIVINGHIKQYINFIKSLSDNGRS